MLGTGWDFVNQGMTASLLNSLHSLLLYTIA